MHKNATKCNETLNKWCKNKHGASKIMDTFETYQGPRLGMVCQPLAPLWVSFGLYVHDRKIGTSGFMSFNSENISRTTFLKYKNSRKQELALWHLVNRLVPENA
jgi:hypothetical protein